MRTISLLPNDPIGARGWRRQSFRSMAACLAEAMADRCMNGVSTAGCCVANRVFAMSQASPSTALDDVTVLDLTRVRAGPTCVRQLADWGAKVIKIEMPEEGGAATQTDFSARHEADFQNLHRNKRSMTLNLKNAEGAAVLRRMVERADIIVENYRPDVKTRLGIDYQALSKVNPRLIYASISGFGQDGPYSDRPGVDQIAQGLSGLMSVTGEPGEVRCGSAPRSPISPQACLLPWGFWSRSMSASVPAAANGFRRRCLQAQIFMLDFQAARYLVSGEVAGQAGNNHPTGAPTGVFRTKDGYVNIAPTPVMWRRFCNAIDREDLIEHPSYATPKDRRSHRDELNERHRRDHCHDDERRAGRAAQSSGHTVRADLYDRSDLRGPAGLPSRDRAECQFTGAWVNQACRSTLHAQSHAKPVGQECSGVWRAHRRYSDRVRLFIRRHRTVSAGRHDLKDVHEAHGENSVSASTRKWIGAFAHLGRLRGTSCSHVKRIGIRRWPAIENIAAATCTAPGATSPSPCFSRAARAGRPPPA